MAEVYSIKTALEDALFHKASCAFGVFDGVHTGHRFLIDAARQTAQEAGGSSVILTFDIDPDEIFYTERLKKLLGNEDRIAMLAQTGVDAVCILPFTNQFASASPSAFLKAMFAQYAPAHLHVGCDFRFGAKAKGTVEDLNTWALQSGTHVHAHSLVSADGIPITATRIRLLLQEGNIEEANRLLGYPYTLSEVVRPGRGDGARFGFATANMEIPLNKRTLAEGVYAAYALVDATRYRAAVAVGTSPVFEAQSSADIEVHILDFNGDLYGKHIAVEFLHRIRGMIAFDSVDALIETVLANIEWVRNNIALER